MKQSLIEAITEIQSNKTLFTLDEASIKSSVVQRLLSVLNWNPFDANEVRPEYSIESKRVDFSLRIDGVDKVFIEVKRPNQDLQYHQEQLLEYAFRQGVRLAVLTNGSTWWFYLPLIEGSWEQRRFYALEFVEQQPAAIADRLIEFLSKTNIVSGTAVANAETLSKGNQKQSVLREALPRAWSKLLDGPDDSLVEVLIDSTEKLSGFRPEVDEVAKFIKSVPDTSGARASGGLGSSISATQPASTQWRSSSRGEDYINKKPRSFTFLGRTYHPKNWKELLVTVAEEMYQRHPTDFNKSLALRGSRMAYFSCESRGLSQPVQISASEFFVETKLNSNSIVKRSRNLITLFGYKEGDLKVIADEPISIKP